jgi:hypothetical protein
MLIKLLLPDIYYFNFLTGESSWDHPCDGYYKRLYEEEKKKKEISLKVRRLLDLGRVGGKTERQRQ